MTSPEPPPATPASDADARLVAALGEYQLAVESGTKPDRAEFLSRFPDIADRLANCLNALAFVAAVIPPHSPVTPTPSEVGPGSVVGEFQLVREVGRGGMGVVYEAVQESLGRRVALKVLPVTASLDGRALQRFRHEAQAAATLQHPHIVPVFAVGESHGVHYYVMQFVDGRSLAAVWQEWRERASATRSETVTYSSPTDPSPAADNSPVLNAVTRSSLAPAAGHDRETARLIAQAADALHHAHECGIVHRDIKPGNLLVDGNGHLWVADFGLARLPGSDLTGTADVMGTLRYMSPEQAAGRADRVDGRSDVYSLGVTLYELLAGRPAFTAEDRRALLRQVLDEEPSPPRRWNPRVPRDLETVCLKAMAKEPADRYHTAGAFRDDLDRFLSDHPIVARSPTLLERGVKWARRNRTLVGVTCTVVLVALVVLAGVLVASNSAIDARRREAEDALGRELTALSAETEAKGLIASHLAAEQQARVGERRTAYRHTVALAFREWQAGQLKRADRLLDDCPPENRRWEWYYLRRLTRPGWGVLATDPAAELKGLGIAPNGDILIVDSEGWGKTTIREGFRREPGSGNVGSSWRMATLTPDGRTAAFHRKSGPNGANTEKSQLATVDLTTGRVLTRFSGAADAATGVAFSPDGRRLATWGIKTTFTVWDVSTGAAVATMSGHSGPVREVAFHPNGNLVASYGEDGTIRFWAADTGRAIRVIRDERLVIPPERSGDGPGEIDFSPDGRELAIGLRNSTVQVWNIETGDLRLLFPAHRVGVMAVKYSPDGRWLATSGIYDGPVQLWSARTGKSVATFSGHEEGPQTFCFEPSGRHLVTGRVTANEVRMWDLTTQQGVRPLGRPVRARTAPMPGILYGAVTYDPSGLRLISTALRGCTVWEPETGHTVGSGDLGTSMALAATFTPDGRDVTFVTPTGGLAWAPGDRNPTRSFPYLSVPRRNVVTGEPIPSTTTAVGAYQGQIAFTGDGTRFAAIDSTSAVSLYDAGGTVLRTLTTRGQAPTYRVTISRDGTHVATVSTDGVVTGWEAANGAELWRSAPLGGKVLALAYDTAGHQLAYGLADGSVGVLKADGFPLHRLQGAGAPILSLAFTPDGDRLVSGHGVGRDPLVGVRVWDSKTGHEVFSIPLPSPVVELAFRPDGLTLAALGVDGRVWLLEGGSPSAADLDEARRRRWAAWHETQVADAEAAQEWWAARWHIDRLLATKPGDATLLARRAEFLARSNRFVDLTPDEAAAVADTIATDDLEPVFHVVARLVETGNAGAYRRLCGRLLGTLTPKTQPSRAGLVYRLCTMGPGGVADPKTLAAECADRLRSADTFARHYLTGALHFRAGAFSTALTELSQVEKFEPESVSPAVAWLFLAMTNHHLGKPDDARKWLARADEWYSRKATPAVPNTKPVEFESSIPFPILRKEAAALLNVK